MSTELALRNADPIAIGEVMYKSGLFPDVKSAAVAAVKIMAGAEYGLGAAAAMSGIDVIDNKPVPRAIVILARVKSSGRYTYRVKEWSNQAAELEFSERVDGKWEVLSPTSRFTMDDAKRAGLSGRQVWQRYPRNMLLWRAGVNGARLHCPEVFGGMPILSAEEAADEADLPIIIVGAEPEPLRVENVAEPEHPSDEAVRKFFEMYLASGQVVEGAGDDAHNPLRVILAMVGANNGVHDGKPTEAVEDCVRALDRGQFERVWKAVAESGEDA